jgi:hypothetical protein
LWLVVLEVTLITSSWMFNFDYSNGPILQVIWAIGVSMLVLAALVRLRWYEVGAIGVAICVLHNLLEGVPMPLAGAAASHSTGSCRGTLKPSMGVPCAGRVCCSRQPTPPTGPRRASRRFSVGGVPERPLDPS